MSLKDRIKSDEKLKQLAIRLMTPKNQPRPRLWVRCLVNPFVHKKGKGSVIKRHTRMDVMP